MDIKEDIKKILYGYLAVDSTTNTPKENMIDAYFGKVVSEIPYFKNNENHYQSEVIPEDIHGRSVNWAMYKGSSSKTFVLIHHTDVVTTENYYDLASKAYKPDELKVSLKDKLNELEPEAIEDLLSDEWLFGRGTADMKGGGAIQLALLKHLSENKSFHGSIIVLALPDEENLSAGMRYAVEILNRLKKANQLDYKLMINSEPHQRLVKTKGVMSQGSIAKMNLFMYVRGVLTHAGKAYEGINPLGILGKMVSNYEMSTAFTDTIDGEMSIPPTWVYLRDLKKQYDVSTPQSAIGFMNLLSFNRKPEDVLEQMKADVINESDALVSRLHTNYLNFLEASRRIKTVKTWGTKVMLFSELKDLVLEDEHVTSSYDTFLNDVAQEVKEGFLSEFDGTIKLIEYLMTFFKEPYLVVVLGLAAPFYPGISNLDMETDVDLTNIINTYTESNYGQSYDNEYYFTGISDLSFSGLLGEAYRMDDMPLWGKTFDIPFETIKAIEMPRINIGPWGKDFHKISERVYMEDLYVRTPEIIADVMYKIMALK